MRTLRRHLTIVTISQITILRLKNSQAIKLIELVFDPNNLIPELLCLTTVTRHLVTSFTAVPPINKQKCY